MPRRSADSSMPARQPSSGAENAFAGLPAARETSFAEQAGAAGTPQRLVYWRECSRSRPPFQKGPAPRAISPMASDFEIIAT
ncbi:MAG: hypothetical protein IPK85_01695 [Gemmatimonadetes bacterium]|nr:hypothetical protein [Gemmatimonadota bacterium]